MERRKRYAADGDYHNYSVVRRKEHERICRSFELNAQEANQNPHAPEPQWLLQYFKALREHYGVGATRRRARTLSVYLRDHGAGELMRSRDIEVTLFCPDDEDPLSFEPATSTAATRHARLLGDSAFTLRTLEVYTWYVKAYVRHCKALGINHLNPPPEVVLDYLASQSHKYGFSTLKTVRSAISHLLVKHGRPDVARTKNIDDLLDGLRKLKPAERLTPLTSEERHRLISSLETEGFGIRDRVALLILAFSRWSCDKALYIDVEDISFAPEGVIFDAGPYKLPMIIGRHTDPDLDLEPWIRKLIALDGGSGPLFQVFELRLMRFAGRRLKSAAFLEILRNAAKKAGIEQRGFLPRLRMLFELECREAMPDVLLRRYNVISEHATSTHPDDRATRLRINRRGGFSPVTP